MVTSEVKSGNENIAGFTRADYRGAPSTLCQGCGHNSISSQIVAACYELGLVPEKIAKFSGIGCSSKSPTYFLSRSFGFNALHGRMPSVALGGLFADITVKGLGISGDGDTASIGMGQFKHLARRNMPMVYIVENNGVYGLTKGQFSATAEEGLLLKHQGINTYLPVDICMEALVTNASFVARGFAGDPKQLKNLLKAAFSHDGLAILDIISPCVTFHNKENSYHSYLWGKEHEIQLHDIEFVQARDEITIEDFEPGSSKEVSLHDGTVVLMKKLDKDYDPTNRYEALRVLEEAERENTLITGLLFVDPNAKTLFNRYSLPEMPLNRLEPGKLRPSAQALEIVNRSLFMK